VADKQSRNPCGSSPRPTAAATARKFRLKDAEPRGHRGISKTKGKDEAQGLLAAGVERLARLQDKLSAQAQWSLLLVFQAMDAAGKDGAIKHVMSA